MFGQQIDCPSCNGAFKLPDSQPRQPATPQKQTLDCPFCGEQILSTAIKCKHCHEFLDGSKRPVAATLPPEHNKAKPQAETEVWKGNPSYLCYLGHFFLGLTLLPLFGFGLFFILYAVLDRNTRVYTLTNKRAMCRAGIISRRIHEVGTKDIRNINILQGMVARLLGVGTVEIESAAAAGQGRVRFAGVGDPISVRDRIRREKDEADSR